ncbi:MAG: dTDP-4-dehydrorhamnose 3,5-epimerase [Patescibacteria group bacterium]
MAFQFRPLEIPDVVEVIPQVFGDERGGFAEMYKEKDFVEAGIEVQFVQFNYSRSSRNVLRGLHYQLNPKAQGKLLTAISGEVFDVAVDIRKGSPTFGRWVSLQLSSAKKNLVYVPEGFAHGFCVTSETAEVMYYVTDVYSPERERGIIWNDPALGIPWPTSTPVLSGKDQVYPGLASAESNFTV